jgi:hypothetical protein
VQIAQRGEHVSRVGAADCTKPVFSWTEATCSPLGLKAASCTVTPPKSPHTREQGFSPAASRRYTPKPSTVPTQIVTPSDASAEHLILHEAYTANVRGEPSAWWTLHSSSCFHASIALPATVT